jgi:hypothetical protein
LIFAFIRFRSLRLVATGTAGLCIIACASAIRVEELRAVTEPDAPTSLAAAAVADLASHADLVVPPDPGAPFSADSSDGMRTIERGTYSGVRVPVRIEAALGGRKKSEHFWRLPGSAGKNSGVVGWRTSRYPIPVAFRHSRPSIEISADDSAVFWKILADMSVDLGRALFEPATLGDADPVDVIVVDLRAMPGSDGFSRASWSSSGEIFDVRVSFGSRSALHDSHVVTHEMTHALGFGHTNAWRSVVNSNERGTARLTPTDVAYIELAMLLRERRERVDMRQLIALAVERELPAIDRRPVYVNCGPEGLDQFADEMPLRNHALLPAGVLAVVSACGGDKNQNGPDTIAVPAAAIDTTTDRLPGATPRAAANPASGVDTPITRKLGSPAPVKRKD